MPISGYSDFVSTSVNSGTFPAALTPASQVSFRFTYEDTFDVGLFVDGGLVNVGATVDVKDPDGNLILSWGFTVTYVLLQGTLFFVYYASNSSVTTTFPVPAPTIIGDPHGIAIPGGGSGGGLGGLDFIETFETPYFVVHIPDGSSVKITHHVGPFGNLNDIAQLQASTRLASAGCSGFRHSRDGEAFILAPDSGGLSQVRSVGSSRSLQPAIALVDSAGAKVQADGNSVVLRATAKSAHLVLYTRSGSTYGRLSFADGLAPGDEMSLFPGCSLLGACQTIRGGDYVLLADKSNAVFISQGSDGTFSAPVACSLPSGVTPSAGVLLTGEASGQLDFYWSSSAGVELISTTNDGLVWSQAQSSSVTS